MERKFSHLNQETVVEAVDILLQEIINHAALDQRIEIRGFGVFLKRILDQENLLIPRPRKSHILVRHQLCISKHQINYSRAMIDPKIIVAIDTYDYEDAWLFWIS